MRTAIHLLSTALLCALPAPSQAGGTYTYFLDRLEIVHSGGTTFVDEFDDGMPPPSVNYGVQGFFGPESGGILTLDDSGAVLGVAGEESQVATQLILAPLTQDIRVSALYDYVPPGAPDIQGYGAVLAWFDAIGMETHAVFAALASTATPLPLALTLTDINVDTGVVTPIGELDVSGLFSGPPVDQVEITLTVFANSFAAEASIDTFNLGVPVSGATLPNVALLGGSSIPSAGFQATTLPEPSTGLGLLAGCTLLVGLERRRRPVSASRPRRGSPRR